MSIVTKSVKDGQKRGDAPLFTVIGLDKSGSMGSKLQNGSQESRMTLAKQATMLFIKNLRPDDRVGLIIFDT